MTLTQQVYFGAPRQAAVRQLDVPPPNTGEVLLRSTLSAISHGTEMNVYRGVAPQWTLDHDPDHRLFLHTDKSSWAYPLAYGYACVGVVESVGEGVPSTLIGERAFCYRPHQSYHVLRQEDLILVGALADDKAVFTANGNTAFNGVLDATMHYGDVIVIFGQGVIGQIIGRLCKASGCRVIVVDQRDDRLQHAHAWGPDTVINPQTVADVALTVRELTENRGADVVFEVTGNPRALHDAVRTAAPDCDVVALSWYAKPAADLVLAGEFHHNRIRIRSSQSGHLNPALANWSLSRRMKTVLSFLEQFNVEQMITARFPIARAAEAYALIDQSENPPLQVVLEYP